MKISKLFILFVLASFGWLLSSGPAVAKMADHARVTLTGNGHTVVVTSVTFTLDSIPVFTDSAPDISTLTSDGASQMWEFTPELDINDFEFTYICDGGQETVVSIYAGQFYFHMPLILQCPSPGGSISLNAGNPNPGDAWLVASDHDVLMWPSSECFEFTGGAYDYICVLWACESSYEPVFSITPGCDDPCGDPACPPASWTDINYSAMYNPVADVWGRVFWPIGLIEPGCWCYYFEYQLPVELQSFAAVGETDCVQLSLTVATEQGNDRFEIFRGESAEGPWTEIGRIASRGDAATEHHYNFTDRNIVPGREYWYYPAYVGIDGERVDRRDMTMSASTTANAIPGAYALNAYPNPFNPATRIEFALAETQHIELTIYDLTGRVTATLASGSFEAGEHALDFDAAALPAGLYFAQLRGSEFTLTQKLVLLK